MNLTWHLARKDIRRLSPILTLWGFVVVIGATLDTLQLAELPPAWQPFPLEVLSFLTSFIAWILTVVLAAQTILEDSLTTSTAFWLTRPISGLRLLAAKTTVLAGIALCPVVPELVPLAVHGASGRELALAAADACVLHAVVVVAIATLASVVPNLTSFVVRTLAILLVAGLFGSLLKGAVLASQYFRGIEPFQQPDTLATSALLATQLLVLVLGAILLIRRYGSPHARWTVASVYLCAFTVFLVGTLWPWDFFDRPPRANEVRAVQPASLSSLRLRAERFSARTSTVTGVIETRLLSGGEFLAPGFVSRATLKPVAAGWAKGVSEGRYLAASREPKFLRLGPPTMFAPDALQQCLGAIRIVNLPDKQPVPLKLCSALTNELVRFGSSPLQLDAELHGAHYRFEIEAEIPAHVGAAARVDRASVRLEKIDLAYTPRGLPVTSATVREQEFHSSFLGERQSPVFSVFFRGQPDFSSRLWNRDVSYLLVNPGRREALLLDRIGAADRNDLRGFRVMHTRLEYRSGKTDAPIDHAWLQQAALVRIRLVELGLVTLPLRSSGLTVGG